MASDAQPAYAAVATELEGDGAASGKMFGMPCIKVGGKAFAGYFEGDMVFKLRGESHQRALALPGAQLFDPMGGRPMKEWVRVPATSSGEWLDLGRAAMETVAGSL